jgi:homogentisate phytyltransferase/homogentisate geranylgeranyltransferase
MIGTMVSVFSVIWMAMERPIYAPLFISKVLHALIPALLLNISIVGLNQLYDKRMDKINKPYLPLVTGEISTDLALACISLCLSVGLYYGVTTNSASIMFTLVGSCLLGVFYSVDITGLRWKRHPILAAACIIGVRSIMVQLGFFFLCSG